MSVKFIAFYILMLLAGIVLTVITIRRMCLGQIVLPVWAKIVLSVAMVLMLVILLLGMLPVKTVDVATEGNTTIITPIESKIADKAAP